MTEMKTNSSETEQSPITQLRLEKLRLKREYEESEIRLQTNWNYLGTHIGSLIFHSVINSFKKPSPEKNELSLTASEQKDDESVLQTVWNGLALSAPMLWDIAQPFLIKFAIKKVKSIFSSKKK